MKAIKTLSFACLALASVAAAPAMAASLSYDFTGHGETAHSHSFESNGVTLDVSAVTKGLFLTVDAKVTKWSEGLGISSLVDLSHEIDGFIGNEFAVLSFSEEIKSLTSATFSYVDMNDTFELFRHDGSKLTFLESAKIDATATGEVTATYTFGKEYAGSTFYIGATGAFDSFKLKALTATTAEMSAVPLPAGAVLLMTGLAGLGAVRRRRKAA